MGITVQFSTGPSYYSHCNQRRKKGPGDKAKGWRSEWTVRKRCRGGSRRCYLDSCVEHGECHGGPDQRVGYVTPLHEPKAKGLRLDIRKNCPTWRRNELEDHPLS